MLVILFLPSSVHADTFNVAVASNFTVTMRHLVQKFERDTGHKVLLSFGSTGRHYAQIKNGAPFDLFFSADSARPKQLEQDGFVVDGMRFTYAYGRLVLWGEYFQPQADFESLLSLESMETIAIANPRLAPYGLAAQQVLESINLEEKVNSKLVKGENVNQAFQFVATGNAEVGFLSYAQMVGADKKNFWLIPPNFYEPIEQQAVMLKDSKAARSFFNFVQSEEALKIISKEGYGVLDVNRD